MGSLLGTRSLEFIFHFSLFSILSSSLITRNFPMPHPLIDQLRFTRSEWLRGLDGVTEADGARHFGPMNSIGWTVGHLAWQEHRYFVERGQGKILYPHLHE